MSDSTGDFESAGIAGANGGVADGARAIGRDAGAVASGGAVNRVRPDADPAAIDPDDQFDEPFREGYTSFDEERWVPEAPKSRLRSEFERDRARLIHSSALRRLGAKTQVQMAGTDDFARTRLTHTLEVAQIGRQLAATLGCDANVVDCACLAHDIGHPPFGHNGETVLSQIAADIGGFEGNAQTLRLLTRLEPKVIADDGRSVGLNLTRASLDAVVKYPWTRADALRQSPAKPTPKFCVYKEEEPVFRWLKQGAPALNKKPMECQVMDLADDIAYSVHDVEDAIVSGAFDPIAAADPHVIDAIIASTIAWYGPDWSADELAAAFDRLNLRKLFVSRFTGSRAALAHLKNVTSALIGRFASAVEQATRARYGARPLMRYTADLIIPAETKYEILALKGIAVHFVMEPREEMEFHKREQQIVRDLVNLMMADSPQPSEALDPQFLDDWNEAADDDERLRVAIDQVASLTDNSALSLHSLLC